MTVVSGEGWTLIHGDCPAALAELADNSVDSVVTDPPYELAFMGKAWDRQGVAFQVELWREVLRVLKPGGHLLAFGGTRTYHRMTVAIEDAGFEIRDCIQWLYGSGFPKSKSMRDIDRPELGTALKPSHEPIVLARKPLAAPTVAANVLEHGTGALNVDATRIQTGEHVPYFDASGGAKFAEATERHLNHHKVRQAGTSTAGRWPSNLVLVHSEGCVKVGRKRVRAGVWGATQNATPGNGGTMGDGWAHRPSRDAGVADADGMEEVDEWRCAPGCPIAALDAQAGERKSGGSVHKRSLASGVVPLNASPLSARNVERESDTGSASRFFPVFAYEADDFVPWLYCAKASRREREAGLEGSIGVTAAERTGRKPGSPGLVMEGGKANPYAGNSSGIARNHHPTVKPLALMSWLCRLVTPPGGVVLDPFTGSGSTGCAALREGFGFIGVEREAEYIEIARRRLDYTLSQQPTAQQARLAV